MWIYIKWNFKDLQWFYIYYFNSFYIIKYNHTSDNFDLDIKNIRWYTWVNEHILLYYKNLGTMNLIELTYTTDLN
jgi:hypothetical protein